MALPTATRGVMDPWEDLLWNAASIESGGTEAPPVNPSSALSFLSLVLASSRQERLRWRSAFEIEGNIKATETAKPFAVEFVNCDEAEERLRRARGKERGRGDRIEKRYTPEWGTQTLSDYR